MIRLLELFFYHFFSLCFIGIGKKVGNKCTSRVNSYMQYNEGCTSIRMPRLRQFKLVNAMETSEVFTSYHVYEH